MSLKESAMRHIEQGFEIFPLVPQSKFPRKGSHGHLDATTDKNQVEAWWSENPNYNIGVRIPKDQVVLDLDDYKDTWRGYDHLQNVLRGLDLNTYTVVSTSGGKHLRYLLPKNSPDLRNKHPLIPSMDIKTHKLGYVLGAGSVVNNSAYKVAKEVPLKILPSSIVAQLSKPAISIRGKRVELNKLTPYSHLAMNEILFDLRRLGVKGNRGYAIFIASLRLHLFDLSSEQLRPLQEALLQAAVDTGSDLPQIKKSFLSGQRTAFNALSKDQQDEPST